MKASDAIPAVVSQRNHFQAADELAENALPYLPEQFKHPAFKQWLIQYTESVIRSVADHYAVAASRGIQQAATLLCDPGYYETRRKRRAKERQLWEDQQKQQEMEWLERQTCPTAQQIQQQIVSYEQQLEYHREQAAAYEKGLEKLRAWVPKNIRLVPKKSDN